MYSEFLSLGIFLPTLLLYKCLFSLGLGCSFVTASCDSWQYACSELDEDGCSYDYQAEVPTQQNMADTTCYNNYFCRHIAELPVFLIVNSLVPTVVDIVIYL